jgi:hypothetical protein
MPFNQNDPEYNEHGEPVSKTPAQVEKELAWWERADSMREKYEKDMHKDGERERGRDDDRGR